MLDNKIILDMRTGFIVIILILALVRDRRIESLCDHYFLKDHKVLWKEKLTI